MTAVSKLAAQYIRMSTDKQDLSPLIQKETIAAYAVAQGMEIVASYEDEGRSGVHLQNRPSLMQLLHDVTESRQFSTVLVYDVSRWGRFQDSDAAAYYEYHCRLHGAAVIYVAEMFGPEVNPTTALLKSMKRAMAAEYSRDLANKTRAGQALVVSRGFQMGPLPPLGYRRCSVSADGKRRVPLDGQQRKLAATDRIEWVLAPVAEVDLVRRICEMYATTRLTFKEISRVGSVEGWRDHQGRPLTPRSLATLVRNEALIGNFVWGRHKHAKSMVKCGPSRHDDCIPRLIDEATWAQIQSRTALEVGRQQTKKEILARLRSVLEKNPLLVSRDFRAQGLPNKRTIRARFGDWAECLIQAGQEPSKVRSGIIARARQRREDGREFGLAIVWKLREDGHAVSFDGRLNVLDFYERRMRLRVLWPVLGEAGQAWRIRVEKTNGEVDFDLLVRMEELYRPKDFFVAPPADVVARFPQLLTDDVPPDLTRFWCRSPDELLERIGTLSKRNLKSGSVPSVRR